jgi:tRNA A-37 threonylcarbamoyl transferase component Bud32
MEDSEPLEKLIEGVADGTLDRGRLPRTHRDPSISQLLAELQILAGVGDVHRTGSASDDSTQPPDMAELDSISDIQKPATSGLGPGSTWGNFELHKKIGEGSFGEVFLARDLWLGHDVALKVLRTTVTDRAKVLHEARMLVRVRHPHVVTVHGADVHGGRMGFWMDFVDGVTLHEVIARDGRRSAGEARAWGQDLCRALAAVHAAGIVHRDVKAQNVMRQAGDGQLILMDFGAGEMLDAPRLGEAAGTPLYLAPELLDGAAATKSSDIYALGVLLFYVVSRQFPFQAATWDELLVAHERGTRNRLEDVRPDLPPSFVDVIERCIDRKPENRYASAGEMLAALRNSSDTGSLHLSGSQTAALPVAALPPAPSPARQAFVRAASLVAGLGVLAFVLGSVACMFFDEALRIDPDFAAGPADYLRVGREALLPFLIFWLVSAAALAGIGGLMYLLRRPLARLRTTMRVPAIEAIKPVTLGATILIAGTAAFLALTIRFYPVYQAVESVRTNSMTSATVSLLEPGGANTNHGLLSAFLSFLLGFAALHWFPRFEARDPSPVLRSLKWATLGLAALVVIFNVIPRRIIWDEFEVVQYENQRAVVLGTRGNELLLYVPESRARPWRRVNAGTPGLERGGTREKLFSKPS